MNVDKLFCATKAFVVHDGKILILKESTQYKDGANSGRYDVVGGRVNPGEHFAESLLREIKEETGLDVELGRPFHVGEWRPVVRDEQWQIIGTFFVCHANTPDVTLSEDHDEYTWIDPAEFKNYNLIQNLHGAFESYLKLTQ